MVSKQLFTSKALWGNGVIILRVIAGLILFRYGLELFRQDTMSGYVSWLTDLKFPAPELMAYTGKGCELAGGVLLTVGLFTRLAAIAVIITMFVIWFIMGEPEFLAADGAFLLMLIALYFLLTGPGKWSLDYLLFDRRTHQPGTKQTV
ncbi:MAG: DoxX family protein [Chitinophagaceae bacterium]|nr:DoxX family protein [Chitinophagaceae bacterium]